MGSRKIHAKSFSSLYILIPLNNINAIPYAFNFGLHAFFIEHKSVLYVLFCQ
jgi:hypothetical protein